MKSLILICFLSISIGCSCVPSSLVDSAMGAVEGRDKTALVKGCGNQLVPGYTYCRVREGSSTNVALTFFAPPARCKDEKKSGCVSMKLYFPDDSPAISHVFKKGETTFTITWKDLIGQEEFSIQDRGFWPFRYRVKFIDDQKRERFAYTEGEIRLRVYDRKYVPLHNSQLDPNYAWEWKVESVDVKMTTGGRIYVGEENDSI